MTIEFDCVSNDTSTVYVNSASFKLDCGKIVTVDRDLTRISRSDNGHISMAWSEIYIWDGENEIRDIEDLFSKGATLVGIEIEDDAPDGYNIEAISCKVYGKDFELNACSDGIGM